MKIKTKRYKNDPLLLLYFFLLGYSVFGLIAFISLNFLTGVLAISFCIFLLVISILAVLERE